MARRWSGAVVARSPCASVPGRRDRRGDLHLAGYHGSGAGRRSRRRPTYSQQGQERALDQLRPMGYNITPVPVASRARTSSSTPSRPGRGAAGCGSPRPGRCAGPADQLLLRSSARTMRGPRPAYVGRQRGVPHSAGRRARSVGKRAYGIGAKLRFARRAGTRATRRGLHRRVRGVAERLLAIVCRRRGQRPHWTVRTRATISTVNSGVARPGCFWR